MYTFDEFLEDVFAKRLVDWKEDDELRRFVSENMANMDHDTRVRVTRLRFTLNHPGFCEGDSLFLTSGLFKSGTTWFGALLNAHPGLYCGSTELHPFSRQVTELYTSRRIDELPEEERKTWSAILLNNRKASLLEQILENADNPHAKRLGARGPVVNIRALLFAFPKVRVPIIIRDPRDVAVSAAHFHGRYYKQGWERFFRNEERTILNPDFVKGWAWQAQDYYRHVLEFTEKYRHNVIYIRYEDLLESPLRVMCEVYKFLGVSWEETLVQQCIDNCSFEKMSGGRKRGEEDQSSFFRKGTSGDWENYFDKDCVELCKKEVGEVMEKLDYRW